MIEKTSTDKSTIGIIGQGYVGLPLAVAFAKKHIVYGYDINEDLIKKLNSGRSHILDVKDENLNLFLGKTYFPTSEIKNLELCDFIIICVPTPLSEDKNPDLSYIISACNSIAKILHKGQFIILESTTYPRTTEEILIPILEKTGLKAGIDFGVAYSPERVDPGNRDYTIENVPKVVGGINEKCTNISYQLYNSIIPVVVKVSNTRTAESVKMLENIFRGVNIALINEMALIFEKMNIDTWEVVDAASTKPYGFMPFYPGPGIGGHCIPLDPYYLSYKAKKYGIIPRIIETSGEINRHMETHVINLLDKGFKSVGKEIANSQILVLGLSYKKNIDDVRESPSIEIIEELIRMNANVSIYDPYVDKIKIGEGLYYSEPDLGSSFEGKDCAIFLVDHEQFSNIDLKSISEKMSIPIIIDCKNIFKPTSDVIYLGIGKRHFAYLESF